MTIKKVFSFIKLEDLGRIQLSKSFLCVTRTLIPRLLPVGEGAFITNLIPLNLPLEKGDFVI